MSLERSLPVWRIKPRRLAWQSMAKWLITLTVVAAAFHLGCQSGECEVTVAYSFLAQEGGGAAVVTIEPSSGQITKNERLFCDARCNDPLKIRRSEDQQTVVVTNVDQDQPRVFLWSAKSPDQSSAISLPSIPDEVRLTNQLALLTLDNDAVAAVDLRTQKLSRLHQLDKTLSPPANAPEDLTVDPAGDYAVVSFQKDSSSGKKRGSRIVIFKLPAFDFVTDIRLPRNRPDLHIDGNPKEQGPGPEVLHISPETDTLSVTLDLYGALGILSWSKAKQGQLNPDDWTLLSTADSPDLTGRSFPDRAAPLHIDGRHYYLVCNAGEEGGSVLVDLAQRQVVWRRPTPPGLETPVFVPSLGKAYSVCSGKTKRRQGKTVTKETHPRDSLYIFDFTSQHAMRDAPVTVVPLGGYTTQIALASLDPPLLLVALGSIAEQADTFITIDPVAGQIRGRHNVEATIKRVDATESLCAPTDPIR